MSEILVCKMNPRTWLWIHYTAADSMGVKKFRERESLSVDEMVQPAN